ncbi:MAG: TonB-dependent receptor [Acidobacteriota bacterium]|nr:TonB-dependent receptor [Blastocatellia bacterium]MDW8413815.1 TonB-dependent receptor [Acidobacteriota bacterium]
MKISIAIKVSLLLLVLVLPVWAQNKKKVDKKAKISGLVVNLTTGEPLARVLVELVGTDRTVYSDADGNFSFEVEPGSYELRATFEGFLESRKRIEVPVADVIPVDIVMSQKGSGEVVEVVANSSSEIAAIEERRVGTTISDIVSLDEIKKDTASDAAGVLQRVTGLTVVDNKYVYVRGLGDRYSNTVLNDAIMPTPQPDRRVVPLDQVPTELVQTMKVLKTFTPDQPGEFAGGLVKIETLEFPNRTTFKLSNSWSANSVTTFQRGLRYPGDRFDFLAAGLGRRRLPEIIPKEQVRRGSSLVKGFSPAELQRFGRAFENIWEPREQEVPLNRGFGLSASKQIGKLGIVGNLTYGNSNQTLNEVRNFFRVAADSKGNPIIFAPTRYKYFTTTNDVRLGGLVSAAYKLNQSNKFLAKVFLSIDAADETRRADGFFDDRGNAISTSRLRYTRTLTNTNQVSGETLVNSWGNAVLTYRFTYSRSTFDDPDLREVAYEFDSTRQKFVYFDIAQSGLRMFSDMRENIREPAVDFSKYFFKSNGTYNFRLGFSWSNRDRGFVSRRLRYGLRGFNGIDNSLRPEKLFSSENIRPDGFELFEDTRPTDRYVALQDIYAGYVMGDIAYRRLRVIGGVRFEHSRQEVRTFDQFAADPTPIVAGLENTDPLPSLGIVYNLTPNFNLRMGYSRTVSRPQFRELSPFEFSDITGGRATLGNPDLKRALIQNFDVRAEKFFSNGQLIAFSFFYKDLDSPIEIVVESTTALRTSFRNVNGAKNKGFEIEARQKLDRVWSRLANMSVNFNYTFVDSNVDIGDQDLSVLTSRERPLAGQSRHVVNAVLDYDIPAIRSDLRLLYNYTGARISDVGTFGLPDTIEKGYPTLDLFFVKRFGKESGRWEFKFTAENILNRLVRFKVAEQPFQVYRRGRNVSFGISYSFF